MASSTLYDSYALGNYTALYQNYYSRGVVNIDCLGAAKYFFCAASYPVCTSDADSIMYAISKAAKSAAGSAMWLLCDAQPPLTSTRNYVPQIEWTQPTARTRGLFKS